MCNTELLLLKICYYLEPIKKKLSISTLDFELKYVMIHEFSALSSLLIDMDFNTLIF